MKKQEILELIVRDPKTIFINGNIVAGKYSEYPAMFQVVGMSNYDKSTVIVKRVTPATNDYVHDEDGKVVRTISGEWVRDERPIEERVSLIYGGNTSMPLRLVLKSEKTEDSLIAETIAQHHEREEKNRKTEEANAHHEAQVAELNRLMFILNVTNSEDEIDTNYYRRIHINLDQEQIDRLVTVLKSALAEVGV